ncbi:unnamed protein product [Adineta steineri]|uniref:HMG box domain-containing protein n=1 Tax=Adineta steineri TaxID=433720 RepID=A0A813PR82_9BILA|nr:unnamed protein product [Adineta steineri]CAF0865350.1 unnamed protein product [Adineta steineri]
MPRTSGSSKKAAKDPNAPKRPLSAFFLFSQDERPDIKKKSPSLSVGDISKEIGARWKKVTDDTKKRYEQKAAVEKQKYEVRVAEYKKSGGGGASSSPAKGGKGGAKASSSKKASPKKGAAKKPASKSKSSDEDNDDDDDEDDEEDEE